MNNQILAALIFVAITVLATTYEYTHYDNKVIKSIERVNKQHEEKLEVLEEREKEEWVSDDLERFWESSMVASMEELGYRMKQITFDRWALAKMIWEDYKFYLGRTSSELGQTYSTLRRVSPLARLEDLTGFNEKDIELLESLVNQRPIEVTGNGVTMRLKKSLIPKLSMIRSELKDKIKIMDRLTEKFAQGYYLCTDDWKYKEYILVIQAWRHMFEGQIEYVTHYTRYFQDAEQRKKSQPAPLMHQIDDKNKGPTGSIHEVYMHDWTIEQNTVFPGYDVEPEQKWTTEQYNLSPWDSGLIIDHGPRIPYDSTIYLPSDITAPGRVTPIESSQTRSVNEKPVAAQSKNPKDRFLVEKKLSGWSYEDIKKEGGFLQAKSTLRGRFRRLTKDKSARVRKPIWTTNDDALLRKAVHDLTIGEKKRKALWKRVSEYIHANQGSCKFGNGICKKRWDELQRTS